LVSVQLALAQAPFSDSPIRINGSGNAFQHLRLIYSTAELASAAAAALYIQRQLERGETLRLQQLSILSDSEDTVSATALHEHLQQMFPELRRLHSVHFRSNSFKRLRQQQHQRCTHLQ
jgi:hypothetical protein